LAGLLGDQLLDQAEQPPRAGRQLVQRPAQDAVREAVGQPDN